MNGIVAAAAASASGIPQFALYLVASVIITIVFGTLYILITPQHDLRLIREGNVAAAVSLGGALLGFAIPLGKSIAQSHDLIDMIIWAGVACVVQLAVFALTGLVVSHEARKIEEGDVATAAFLAFVAVAAGLLNAACMTYTPS